MGKKKKRQTVIDSILADKSADNTYSGLEYLIYGKQKDVMNRKPDERHREKPQNSGEERNNSSAAKVWTGNTAETGSAFEKKFGIDRQLFRHTGTGEQTRSLKNRAPIKEKRITGSKSALKKSEEETVEVTREGITVQLRDSNGKLKVKVFSGRKRVVSKEKLANIALDAILKELNKEG